MKFLNYCGRICVVLDMFVLVPIFGTSTTQFSVDTHEVSEVLRAHLFSVLYGGSKTNICY